MIKQQGRCLSATLDALAQGNFIFRKKYKRSSETLSLWKQVLPAACHAEGSTIDRASKMSPRCDQHRLLLVQILQLEMERLSLAKAVSDRASKQRLQALDSQLKKLKLEQVSALVVSECAVRITATPSSVASLGQQRPISDVLCCAV